MPHLPELGSTPQLDDLARRLDLSTLGTHANRPRHPKLRRRHADMLWRIRTVNETSFHLLVLSEFQSTVVGRMAFRTMNYVGGIWTGLDSNHLGPRGVFPLVLPIVVYSGRRRWTVAGRRQSATS